MSTEFHDGQVVNDLPEGSQVAIRPQNTTALSDFEPRDVDQAVKQIGWLDDFKKQVLKEGIDYMVIPGTKKNSLLQPGAEKMAFAWKAMPVYRIVNRIEDHDREWTYKVKDWNSGEVTTKEALGWFSYEVECRLIHSNTNQFMGSHLSSFTSRERGREDSPSHVILMMAQKRAYIAAVRTLAFCSHIFTQDEDTFKGGSGGGSNKSEDGFPSKYADAYCGFCQRKHVQKGEMITKTGGKSQTGKDVYGSVACRDGKQTNVSNQQQEFKASDFPEERTTQEKPVDERKPVTALQVATATNLIAKHEMPDERANKILEFLEKPLDKGGATFAQAAKYIAEISKMPERQP